MASVGKGARLKGQNFERTLAKILSEATGLEWKRGLNQTRGGGAETSDVICEAIPWLHIEAKNQARCNIKAAMAQATADVEANHKTPVVITKNTGEETLVTMKLDDWLEFLKTKIVSLS